MFFAYMLNVLEKKCNLILFELKNTVIDMMQFFFIETNLIENLLIYIKCNNVSVQCISLKLISFFNKSTSIINCIGNGTMRHVLVVLVLFDYFRYNLVGSDRDRPRQIGTDLHTIIINVIVVVLTSVVVFVSLHLRPRKPAWVRPKG